MGNLMTLKEVREELKIKSRVTLWKWVKAGKLSVVKLSERKVYIERSELERFINEKQEISPIAYPQSPEAPPSRCAPAADPLPAIGHPTSAKTILTHPTRFGGRTLPLDPYFPEPRRLFSLKPVVP